MPIGRCSVSPLARWQHSEQRVGADCCGLASLGWRPYITPMTGGVVVGRWLAKRYVASSNLTDATKIARSVGALFSDTTDHFIISAQAALSHSVSVPIDHSVDNTSDHDPITITLPLKVVIILWHMLMFDSLRGINAQKSI